MEQKKIGAAYIRVSTDDQLDYSPESQIKLIQDYAKKNSIVVPEEFIFRDDGISGRSAKKRPGFLRMIAAAKEKPRPFEVILVWKFSRFARNQEESVVYKSLLKKEAGVDVVSISEPLIEGPFGGLIERIIEWFDAFYSVNLGTEVRRGMTERVRQGGAVSTAPIGYIYKDRQLVVEPQEAEVVRMIYRDFLSGSAVMAITKKLNSLGIKTKRGGVWENRTVRYVLTNPVYIGRVRWSPEGTNDYHKTDGWNDKTMLVDGAHEAILSEADFEAAQEAVETYVRRYKGNADRAQRESAGMMLQGLVKCSTCGGTLSRTGSGGMNCVRYTHGKCTESHYITVGKLEEIVLTGIELQLNNLQAEIIRREMPGAEDQAAVLRQQLKREETILQKCKAAYLAGADTLEEYKENKAACKERIKRIQELLAEQEKEKPVDVQAFAERTRPVLAQLRDAAVPPEKKNQLLRSFVDRIIFDNKTKTVTIVYYE